MNLRMTVIFPDGNIPTTGCLLSQGGDFSQPNPSVQACLLTHPLHCLVVTGFQIVIRVGALKGVCYIPEQVQTRPVVRSTPGALARNQLDDHGRGNITGALNTRDPHSASR